MIRGLDSGSAAAGRGDHRLGPARPAPRHGEAPPRWSSDPSPARFSSGRWGAFLAALYPLLAAAPLAAFAASTPASGRLRGAELGADCAVVGFTILALQFVLTARLSWIERPFGLDVILGFHRAMAVVAALLLVAHPVLVASEEGWGLLAGTDVEWYVWLGRGALALVLFQVALGLARGVFRVPFDRWRKLHDPAALGILALGFVHGLAAGDDIQGAGLLVWTVLPVVALGCWLHRRVARPRRLLQRAYRVVAAKPEAPRVWTLTLDPRDGNRLAFAPGQFAFLRLFGAEVPSEEHPFTIASGPGRSGRIRFTIKESGDFTARIGRVRPGDRATVHGPFGRFSYALHPEDGDLVFVAGGAGITPLMSMLRAMRDRADPRRVTLAYASRGEPDILFRRELESIESGVYPVLRVVHVLSEASRFWPGETGRIDAERLARLCGGFEGKAFYLCCPPAMTKALVRGLRRLGVSDRRIHVDQFSF